MGKFIPDLYKKEIYDIDFYKLYQNGIKGLIIDIDNTLVGWNEKYPDDKSFKLIEKLKETGYEICLISNNSKSRVDIFNEKLNLFAIGKALKPKKWAYKKAMKHMNLKENQIACIGDQIFTDIYGANRMGMKSILIDPITQKEFRFIRLKRFFEKFIIKKIKKT